MKTRARFIFSGLCLGLFLTAGSARTMEQDADGAAVETSGSAAGTTSNHSVNHLVIKMATQVNEDDALKLVAPAEAFNSDVSSLYVTVGADAGPQLDLTAQVIADNVSGQTAGNIVVTTDQVDGGGLRPETPTASLRLNIGDSGLAPGDYRLEVLDAESRRLIGAVNFSTHPRPLPPADTFTINLTEGEPSETNLPTIDFPTFPTAFFASVSGRVALQVDLFGQVIAVDAKPLPHGYVMRRLGNVINQEFGPEKDITQFVFDVPNMGFPPGKYRFEARITAPPHTLIFAKDFSAHDGASDHGVFNLANTNWGGAMESVSGEEGVGLSGAASLLVAGNGQSWQPYGAQTAKDGDPVTWYPSELVISFFNHQSAKVSSVELVAADDQHGVHQAEVWASNESATEGFTQLVSLENTGPDLSFTLSFPPTDAKYIKVRILSSQAEDGSLRLNEIRVREAKVADYHALRERAPAMEDWRLQPHYAAQRGLEFLQPSAVTWQRDNNCLGCHVQSQALMGLSIAKANDYRVSGRAERILSEYISHLQRDPGNFSRSDQELFDEEISTSDFAAMGMAYASRTAARDQAVTHAAHWLLTHQTEDGAVHGDDSRAPIEQGELMFTTNALKVWHEALQLGENAEVRAALGRALAYIDGADASTTQDKAFQILGLSWFGDAAQKAKARDLAVKLLAVQQSDGGWLLEDEPGLFSSNFATGQALFALKTAGVSPNTAAFRRGVMYLLTQQRRDGSWLDPDLSTPFAATMWPVIALSGAFAHREEPGHIVVTALPRQPKPIVAAVSKPTPTPLPINNAQTIEFVLDCSYSMNQYIGAIGVTRLKTAKTVLHQIIARLPADTQVGLRFYGHRYMSLSGKSSHDTELVVPIQRLNRDLLNKTIDAVQAKGQTPLVFSTLQAGADLAKIGGGSIILVTDGEESCGGNPRTAGVQLAALAGPVHLDIVGFTLTGRRVTADLVAFTGATGGHYYTAADGLQLAAALSSTLAPTTHSAPVAVPVPPPPPEPVIEDFAYEVVNVKNETVAASRIRALNTADLPPGDYSVNLHDGARTISAGPFKIATGDNLELEYDPGAQRLKPRSEAGK